MLSEMLLLSIFLLCLTPIALSYRNPECDGRNRPTNPSIRECRVFLYSLLRKAEVEPSGAYRWYGRRLDACPECVKLPSIIYSGHHRCAALIDVEDEYEDEVSIFGLIDLWRALGLVMKMCWIDQKQNGRAWPAGQIAFARFTRGTQGIAVSKKKEDVIGNRTVSMIDLDDLAMRTESTSKT